MIQNPFDRAMFESQVGNRGTIFILVLVGGFLLVGILYLVRSYLRGRGAGLTLDETEDRALTTTRRGFLGNVVRMVSGKPSHRRMALRRLARLDPPSVCCTVVRAADGREVDQDAGRAAPFRLNGELFLKDSSFFITAPDGVETEDRRLFAGKGEVVNLWFLHERVPYAVDCEVVERVQFPSEMLRDLDPRVGEGYRLVPLTRVTKRDRRRAIRFSHKVGRGGMRLYSQILFDVYVQKTDFRFPADGRAPSRINGLKLLPYREVHQEDQTDFSSGRVVSEFKKGIRMNPPADRQVYVSKPYLDEKRNRRRLIHLGYAAVLGLGAQEDGRTIHLKKPMRSMRVGKRRRNPHRLEEGDTLVLSYFIRSPADDKNEYSEMVCQIVRCGVENITVRPRRNPRQERGLSVEMLGFSISGLRFENSQEFLRYVFGEYERPPAFDEQKEVLENTGFVFTFYPRLRFTHDTEVYKPELPLKFSILGRMVRCVTQKEEGMEERLAEFGVRFMYDPDEYSVDDLSWDRWARIRPFKENRNFKEVHRSLNGLIAHLESRSRDFLKSRRPSAQTPKTAMA